MTMAIVVALILIVLGKKAVAKGLVLGTLFSIINFVLMRTTIPLTLGHSRAKASLIGLTSVLFRYLILAVPLIVGIKFESFNFAAVVVGIFAVQLALLFNYLVLERHSGEGK